MKNVLYSKAKEIRQETLQHSVAEVPLYNGRMQQPSMLFYKQIKRTEDEK